MTEVRYSPSGGPFRRWSDLIDYYRTGLKEQEEWRNWLFRGHQCDQWKLKSSLERAVVDRAGDNPNSMARVEKGLLRRFKRQAHHYVNAVPADDAWMEWQALMQHFGAPTRLLDWTYSFFVAAFFAVENVEPDKSCSIWAFDSSWWYHKAESALPSETRELIRADPNTKRPETVDAILNSTQPVPLVFPINPERLNERLVIQQGAFLVPGDVSRTFTENMSAPAGEDDASPHLLRLDLAFDIKELRRAIRELHSMNINRATLFPGLDGFSAHFKNLIFLREEIATNEERLKGPG
jgi:hypothetical protein